jgi:hypothetical protein
MRRVLERIRRLTVPRSVIDKLAEFEARIGAADAAYRELSGRHQTLTQEHEALSARNTTLGQAMRRSTRVMRLFDPTARSSKKRTRIWPHGIKRMWRKRRVH